MNIETILTKEKDLNNALSLKNCPEDINEQFESLFSNPFYQKTYDWFDKNKNKTTTLHDSFISNFSQKKQVNEYNISFELDSMSLYSGKEQIGYITDSQFKIKSPQSLRDLNNKCILNFLIDEDNKEIAFLYLNNWQRKVISIKYSDIEFIKGKEVLYENEDTNKNKFKP